MPKKYITLSKNQTLPFSNIVKAGGFVFISGHAAMTDDEGNKLTDIERDRILIHELLHIPVSFQGGYRTHNPWVTKNRVEQMHRKYQKLKN